MPFYILNWPCAHKDSRGCGWELLFPALAHRVVGACASLSQCAKVQSHHGYLLLIILANGLRLLANVCQDAAVYVEDVPVDEVAGIAGQEHGRPHKVFGSAPTPGRSFGKNELIGGMTAAIWLCLA